MFTFYTSFLSGVVRENWSLDLKKKSKEKFIECQKPVDIGKQLETNLK